MSQDTIAEQCTDSTKELSIKVPCRLAKRVESYPQETDNTIEGVNIEALDQLLRNRTSRSECRLPIVFTVILECGVTLRTD